MAICSSSAACGFIESFYYSLPMEKPNDSCVVGPPDESLETFEPLADLGLVEAFSFPADRVAVEDTAGEVEQPLVVVGVFLVHGCLLPIGNAHNVPTQRPRVGPSATDRILDVLSTFRLVSPKTGRKPGVGQLDVGLNRHNSRLLIVALSVCAMGNALAVERLMRRYDWRAGFPIQTVYNLEQDDRGFLWIAGNALFRWDGREMRRWSNARGALVPGSARVGRTSILDEVRHTVCRVTPSGVEPVVNARGQPLAQVVSAAYSDDGSLWYVPLDAPRELWRLSPDGAAAGTPFWSATEDIGFLRQGGGATIVAITGRGASRLGPRSPPRTWALPGVRDVLVRADGTLVMAVNGWSGVVHHRKHDAKTKGS